MKKIFSIISAFTFFSSIPIYAYAAEKDDPELYQKAYSLGADKDYLSIINYSHRGRQIYEYEKNNLNYFYAHYFNA